MDSGGSVFTPLVLGRVRFRIARAERKMVSSERNRSVATSFVTFECAMVRDAEFFANRHVAQANLSVTVLTVTHYINTRGLRNLQVLQEWSASCIGACTFAPDMSLGILGVWNFAENVVFWPHL